MAYVAVEAMNEDDMLRFLVNTHHNHVAHTVLTLLTLQRFVPDSRHRT